MAKLTFETDLCKGCGLCVSACPKGCLAISGPRHHGDIRTVAYLANPKDCLGCGLCAATCPKQVIGMVPQETAAIVMCSSHDKGAVARKKCKNACIGCKKCEKVCPNGAVSVQNDLATVDYAKCTGCGLCAKACPTGALKQVVFPDAKDA